MFEMPFFSPYYICNLKKQIMKAAVTTKPGSPEVIELLDKSLINNILRDGR